MLVVVLRRERVSDIGRHLSPTHIAPVDTRMRRYRTGMRRQIKDVAVVLLEELLVFKVSHFGLSVVRVDGHEGLTNGAQGM